MRSGGRRGGVAEILRSKIIRDRVFSCPQTMDSFIKLVCGKRVTLMGLGVLGRGVGDAEFLAQCGAHVLVTDKKNSHELRESLVRLKKYPNISYRLGGHIKKDFIDTDMVIKAAGVPLDSPSIEAAWSAGVPIYMSTALFAKYAPATIVGVTGTRGKSTVTQMIYECLERAGRRAHVGGNVRGMSTLALLGKVKKGDIAVLELDSWQLQGFGGLKISPHISIFTNLLEDHYNYYPNSASYFTDKSYIFTHQKKGDVLITGRVVAQKIRALRPPTLPRVLVPIPRAWKLKILGDHNRENAAFAAEALRALHVPAQKIRKGLEEFKGVPGRLELLGTIRGARVYNDSNATTPDATLAALGAFKRERVVLIAGGTDKKVPLAPLIAGIKKRKIPLVLLDGSASGTRVLADRFPRAPIAASAREALIQALAFAAGRGVILFSPALASFGIFKNEYDRGDAFRAAFRYISKKPAAKGRPVLTQRWSKRKSSRRRAT